MARHELPVSCPLILAGFSLSSGHLPALDHPRFPLDFWLLPRQVLFCINQGSCFKQQKLMLATLSRKGICRRFWLVPRSSWKGWRIRSGRHLPAPVRRRRHSQCHQRGTELDPLPPSAAEMGFFTLTAGSQSQGHGSVGRGRVMCPGPRGKEGREREVERGVFGFFPGR